MSGGPYGRGKAPERACMPIDQWPEADRRLWLAACATGDILDEEVGARSGYARISNTKAAKGYGRWLTYLAQSTPQALTEQPATRITPEWVPAYVDCLIEIGNSTHTILCRLQELGEVAKVIDPNRRWSFINDLASKIRARHRPARDKSNLRLSNELVDLGIKLIRSAEDLIGFDAAIAYRDGFLVAFLALIPMRRRNLADLVLDKTFLRQGSSWTVAFGDDATKAHAAFEIGLPDVLGAPLETYLAVQIAQCRAYCERQGWEVVEVFCEPGASALDDDRAVFQEMIHKATRPERPFSYVVVHSLSRFSRDSLHSELYIRNLRKAGVELVSITQTVSSDPSGEMFRKLLNVFDEHQSRENAKHVHRAMCENARQGFWNGSHPPFGYRTQIAERRGAKDKKALVVDAEEARVVRQIFDLASGREGRPLGVKAIACRLTDRGATRRGVRFSTGSVYAVLTSSTYHGQHYFNRRDSRTGAPRPPSQWVGIQVPAIIDESTFNSVQALLQFRNPKRTPPRVVNGPTFLAGLIRCGYCGAAMIQNTGKGGRYRYYCCSRKLKEGPSGCRGLRTPMEKLDDIVVGEVARHVLDPVRLTATLDAYVQSTAAQADSAKALLAKLRHDHTAAVAGITRLLELVEKGLMEAEDPVMRERLVGLKLQRDQIAKEIGELQNRMASSTPTITPEKVARVGGLLRDKLYQGPPEFRQAYARLLMEEVRVTDAEIRISGSKSVLARCAAEGVAEPAPRVLSFVQEWRARRDSNS
jgi:site-specific DNA recombinase